MESGCRRWTFHPVPRHDESFSSWLNSVARGNSGRPHTFCHAIWPGRQIWTRDVDQIIDPTILQRMSKGTGVPEWRVFQTTLGSYKGRLYSERVGHAIPPHILPLGIYHRVRRNAGQQFCPKCLRESRHYQLKWRLAFLTVCLQHSCKLYDSCPQCMKALSFHRSKDPIRCAYCHYDLSMARVRRAGAGVLQFEADLMRTLIGEVGHSPTFGAGSSVEAFLVLRQLCRVIGHKPRGVQLQIFVRKRIRAKGRLLRPDADFESRPHEERHAIMCILSWLCAYWPERLLASCRQVGMWRSWLIKDAVGLPDYFTKIIDSELLRPNYRDACMIRQKFECD